MFSTFDRNALHHHLTRFFHRDWLNGSKGKNEPSKAPFKSKNFFYILTGSLTWKIELKYSFFFFFFRDQRKTLRCSTCMIWILLLGILYFLNLLWKIKCLKKKTYFHIHIQYFFPICYTNFKVVHSMLANKLFFLVRAPSCWERIKEGKWWPTNWMADFF